MWKNRGPALTFHNMMKENFHSSIIYSYQIWVIKLAGIGHMARNQTGNSSSKPPEALKLIHIEHLERASQPRSQWRQTKVM